MRGSKFLFMPASQFTDAVEQAHQQHKEECEARMARRMNGKDPEHKNGPWPGQKPGEVKE